MVEKEQTIKVNMKTVMGIVALILTGILVWSSFYFLWRWQQEEKVTGYYLKTSLSFCNMANIYRNITIIQEPEIVEDIAPPLDCEKYLFLEK